MAAAEVKTLRSAHRERAHAHAGTAGASRPSRRNGFTACFVRHALAEITFR
jgi:hypothetical protein